MTSNLIKVAEY